MLFEHQVLTPRGRLVAMEKLFEQHARREGELLDHGHVPVEVLEAFGAFETPVRHALEAAVAHTKDRTHIAALRKIEKTLNALPDALMGTLCAEPSEDWLGFYRRLIELHNLITDTAAELDPEEYEAMLQRMVLLADSVSRHSRVRMEAAAAFTLLLMQIELQRQRPKKAKRKPKRKKKAKRKPAAKRTEKTETAEA
ncbi:MAG: hypothetical protein MJ051_07485 [Akkermansia sp.]|nr:hypothetical protein [Akkermansia sp.]